jgi:hypothetical protein
VTLPKSAQSWIDDVRNDHRYKNITDLRNSLTHARVSRHFSLDGPMKINLEKSGSMYYIDEIVTQAKQLATRHVEEMLRLLQVL